MSRNTELAKLYCFSNQIMSIDISNNTKLKDFFALPGDYTLSSKSLDELKKFGFDPAKAKKNAGLSDEELRIIAGGRDGEENDSKPGSASTPTAIAWDEKGRAIQWKDGKDIYHYECCKCHKWLYLDWVRWYCPECGEGFYWNVEKYRVYDVKGD